MFIRYIANIGKMGHCYAQKKLKPYQITPAEQGVLMSLLVVQNATADRLSELLLYDKTVIAKILAQLEKKGLITRSINEKNKREKLIELTDQGKVITGEAQQLAHLWCTKLCTGIPKEEMLVFEKVLADMLENARRLMEATASEPTSLFDSPTRSAENARTASEQVPMPI